MDAAQIAAGIVLAVLIVGPVAVVAWGRTGWLRNRPKPLPYGAAWTLMAFTLASASALLNFGTAIYAYHIRGFRHYDPTLLRIYDWGLGLALVAFFFSWPGKNTESPLPLRLKVPILASWVLLIWLLAALSE